MPRREGGWVGFPRHGRGENESMRDIRFRFPLLLGLLACLLAAGCRRSEGHDRVIVINPAGGMDTTLSMYVKAGALGGTSAEVSYGEFATLLERSKVGPDVPGATPGEWVRIRTIIQPREG